MTRPSARERWGRPAALTIAGSDSGGGAGIQADLKTFQALGVYGMSAITALTAQNTLGVRAVHEAPTEVVAAQIDAVVEDLGVDGVKIGMLSSAPIVRAVAARIRHWQLEAVLVIDPVMVAKGGDRLLRDDAVAALRDELLPLAAVLTPNIPEAEVLTGRTIRTDDEVREAARALLGLGPRAVVLKGGHREGDATDLFVDVAREEWLPARRIETRATHGTGCTFSAAIAARIALGDEALEAVRAAKAFLTGALAHATPIGAGHGPVAHDWALRRTT
ncbi:MAG TPA: bifunctional hydroxymethylpyrimidine kinase/phosphomethylpyrimidine kinase [Candidatus Limnocylindria bacterium]|nr:bifunctional hydroxymethylpyrimidine kinase/phosphomethylpyrimidine kinase [Candidatus Limnocylindria bacterium]